MKFAAFVTVPTSQLRASVNEQEAELGRCAQTHFTLKLCLELDPHKKGRNKKDLESEKEEGKIKKEAVTSDKVCISAVSRSLDRYLAALPAMSLTTVAPFA